MITNARGERSEDYTAGLCAGYLSLHAFCGDNDRVAIEWRSNRIWILEERMPITSNYYPDLVTLMPLMVVPADAPFDSSSYHGYASC